MFSFASVDFTTRYSHTLSSRFQSLHLYCVSCETTSLACSLCFQLLFQWWGGRGRIQNSRFKIQFHFISHVFRPNCRSPLSRLTGVYRLSICIFCCSLALTHRIDVRLPMWQPTTNVLALVLLTWLYYQTAMHTISTI